MLTSLRQRPEAFILVHSVVWWLTIILARPALDSQDDMTEVYAWSQHWLAGSDKHPQLLPWIAKLWFAVAPKTVASFYLLAALNLAVAFIGIAALGRALGLSRERIFCAIATTALAFPYLTLSAKLNMNAICLSAWPWLGYFFVKALSEQPRRSRLYAALFGAMAAASLMGKYSSVVLLIPMFAYTLIGSARGIWTTSTPWIAIATFAALVAPHVIWLIDNPAAVGYASEQASDNDLGFAILQLLKFVVVAGLYWPLPLAAALVFLCHGTLWRRTRTMLRPPEGNPLIALLTIGPWLTTILFGLSGLVELSMPWAIPFGFAFGVYLSANADPGRLSAFVPYLAKSYLLIWPLMLVCGFALSVHAALTPTFNTYRPAEEASAMIHSAGNGVISKSLTWIAAGPDANLLSFFSPLPLEALPERPDRLPSYYPEPPHWKETAGAIVCSFLPFGQVNQTCLRDTLAWAHANGLEGSSVVLVAKRKGLRFPADMPFELAVVYVQPH